MKKRAVCVRCGREAALSEDQLARARAKAVQEEGPPPPPLPAGICFRCAFKDPELQEPLREWMKLAVEWSDRRMAQVVRRARELAVRPLEAIDRFIDTLR